MVFLFRWSIPEFQHGLLIECGSGRAWKGRELIYILFSHLPPDSSVRPRSCVGTWQILKYKKLPKFKRYCNSDFLGLSAAWYKSIYTHDCSTELCYQQSCFISLFQLYCDSLSIWYFLLFLQASNVPFLPLFTKETEALRRKLRETAYSWTHSAVLLPGLQLKGLATPSLPVHQLQSLTAALLLLRTITSHTRSGLCSVLLTGSL